MKWFYSIKSFVKTVSVLTLFLFIFSSLHLERVLQASAPPPPEAKGGFFLPPSHAEVLELHTDSPGKPFIVYIQDAHAAPEAQRNIRRIIRRLEEDFEIRRFFLEGAQGSLEPVLISEFPDEPLKRKVIDGYLSAGELTGAEIAALEEDSPSLFEGVEDWDLYEKNYAEYLTAVSMRHVRDEKISSEMAVLENGRAKKFSPFLKRYWEAAALFYNNSDVSALLRFIQSEVPKDAAEKLMSSYPQIRIFFKAVFSEGEAEARALQITKDLALRFKKEKVHRLAPEKQKEFTARHQAFATGQMPALELLEYLAREGSASDLMKGVPEDVRAALENLRSLRSLSPVVFREIHLFLRVLEDSWKLGPEERETLNALRKLNLLKRFSALELADDEFSELENQKKSHFPAIDLSADEWAGAFGFYRLARERDQAMLHKMTQIIEDKGIRRAALIAGGYHSKSITAFLKNSGFNYAVVQPKILLSEDGPDYHKIMRGEVSFTLRPHNSYFESFMRSACGVLLQETPPQQRKEKAGLWKEALLSKLAAQGRLALYERFGAIIDNAFMEASGRSLENKTEFPAEVRAEVERFAGETVDGLWRDFLSSMERLSGFPGKGELSGSLVPRLVLDPSLPPPRPENSAEDFESSSAARSELRNSGASAPPGPENQDLQDKELPPAAVSAKKTIVLGTAGGLIALLSHLELTWMAAGGAAGLIAAAIAAAAYSASRPFPANSVREVLLKSGLYHASHNYIRIGAPEDGLLFMPDNLRDPARRRQRGPGPRSGDYSKVLYLPEAFFRRDQKQILHFPYTWHTALTLVLMYQNRDRIKGHTVLDVGHGELGIVTLAAIALGAKKVMAVDLIEYFARTFNEAVDANNPDAVPVEQFQEKADDFFGRLSKEHFHALEDTEPVIVSNLSDLQTIRLFDTQASRIAGGLTPFFIAGGAHHYTFDASAEGAYYAFLEKHYLSYIYKYLRRARKSFVFNVHAAKDENGRLLNSLAVTADFGSAPKSARLPRVSEDPPSPGGTLFQERSELRAGEALPPAEEDVRQPEHKKPQRVELMLKRFSSLTEDERSRLKAVLEGWRIDGNAWDGVRADAFIAYLRTSEDGSSWRELRPAAVASYSFNHDYRHVDSVWIEEEYVDPEWKNSGLHTALRLQDAIVRDLKRRGKGTAVFYAADPHESSQDHHKRRMRFFGDAVTDVEYGDGGRIETYFVRPSLIPDVPFFLPNTLFHYDAMTGLYKEEGMAGPPEILVFRTAPPQLWASIKAELGLRKRMEKEGTHLYESFLYPGFYFKNRDLEVGSYRPETFRNNQEEYASYSRRLARRGLGIEEAILKIAFDDRDGGAPRASNITFQKIGIGINGYLSRMPDQLPQIQEMEYAFLLALWSAGYFDADFKRPNLVLLRGAAQRKEIRLIDFDFVSKLPARTGEIESFLLERGQEEGKLTLSRGEHFIKRLFVFEDAEDDIAEEVRDFAHIRRRLFPDADPEKIRAAFLEAKYKGSAEHALLTGEGNLSKEEIASLVHQAYWNTLDSHPEVRELILQLAGHIKEARERSELREAFASDPYIELFLGRLNLEEAEIQFRRYGTLRDTVRNVLLPHASAQKGPLKERLAEDIETSLSSGDFRRLRPFSRWIDIENLRERFVPSKSPEAEKDMEDLSLSRRFNEVRFLLAAENRELLKEAYSEKTGAVLESGEKASIYADAFFLRNTPATDRERLIQETLSKGYFVLAYRKGTESDEALKGLFRFPGTLKRSYSSGDPLDLIEPLWEKEEIIFLLARDTPLSLASLPPGKTLLRISQLFFFKTGLNAAELLTLVWMMKDRSGKEFGEDEVLGSLEFLEGLMTTNAVREAMSRSA